MSSFAITGIGAETHDTFFVGSKFCAEEGAKQTLVHVESRGHGAGRFGSTAMPCTLSKETKNFLMSLANPLPKFVSSHWPWRRTRCFSQPGPGGSHLRRGLQ